MRRALSIVLAVSGVLLLIVGGAATLALRDNPSREAVGKLAHADSAGVSISYSTLEPTTQQPARATVALVPSYARSAADFNELVVALAAAGYRTIAMQPRGIEGSELPDFDNTLENYANDLAAVLDAEQVAEPAIVLGHAWGNRIARVFSQLHPERVDALILLAAGGDRPPTAEGSAAIGKAMLRIYPESVRREAIQLAFFARQSSVPDDWLRGWYPLAGFAEGAAVAASPYESWSAGGDAPIFVLEPAEDFLAPGAGERLRAQLPQRVVVTEIEAAGHALLPEQPERVLRRVLEILSARTPGQHWTAQQ